MARSDERDLRSSTLTSRHLRRPESLFNLGRARAGK